MNPNYISTLKINGLYWIPAKELRKLLRKLENLEELMAIDTKLGFRKEDVVEYYKLKKIAVSVEEDHFQSGTIEVGKKLSHLRTLYLKIVGKTEINGYMTGMRLFFHEIKQLEELWIFDYTPQYGIIYDRLVAELKNLRKIVIRSRSYLPNLDLTFMGLSKVYKCRSRNLDVEMIFERIPNKRPSSRRSIFEPRETELDRAWEVFENLRIELPCGPKEHKVLFLNGELTNIHFEELNFEHTVLLCNQKCVDAAHQVLRSENSKGLRKLNIRSCLLQHTSVPQYRENNGFKRFRYGIITEAANHPFQKIAENLRELRELEIYRCKTSVEISAYPLIGTFENLLKLALEIPPLLDGSFLKQVFLKCPKLEWLSLKCLGPNQKFMMNLCQNLKYSTSLRHFRLEHDEIVIDKLLSSLTQSNKKLLRVFLSCNTLRYTSNISQKEHFSVFMENNPQLVCFVLVINDITLKEISDIQKTVHQFKRGNPAKIFHAKRKKCFLTSSEEIFIPSAHHDFILNRTNVSVIDFNQF